MIFTIGFIVMTVTVVASCVSGIRRDREHVRTLRAIRAQFEIRR